MTRGVLLCGIAGMLLGPAPLAAADDGQQGAEAASGQAHDSRPPAPVWVKGPYGKLYPVGGWRNCAEAWAHSDVPVMRGDPGYNPALDPTGSGIECA